jgi:hypothetical protein
MEPSCSVRADVAKNRLYIVLKGSIPDETAKLAAEQVMEETKKLSAGFCVVNDISGMQPAGPKGAAEIKRAQAFLGYMGVRRIIRIVHPTDTEVKKQFENTPTGYPTANTASSIEEADAILDQPV